jgi:surface antigen
MTHMRFTHAARWWTARVAALLMVAAVLFAVQSASRLAAPARAANGTRPHLLLIHGFTDSCDAAWNTTGTYTASLDSSNHIRINDSKDKAFFQTTEPNDTTALSYLTNHTNWQAGDITTVGYYNNDSLDCGVNLNTDTNDSWATDAKPCYSPVYIPGGPNPYGSYDDPIMHLACLFAWYIYDDYTKSGVPVEILAHSMGGLITRAAIGGSNAGATGFPHAALLVPDVVTVATPHGGIGGIEQTSAWFGQQGDQELADMDPASTFMSTMGETAYEKPQGTGGTHWALIGSSVPSGPPGSTTLDVSACVTGANVPATASLARALSCLQLGVDNNSWPDGDGVVNAESQMAMPADFKVLYGVVEDKNASVLHIASTATEYEHETGTCQSIVGGPAGTCAAAPFYLNDGLPPDPKNVSTYTEAFVCQSNCTAADFSDFNLSQPAAVWHSLAEIASQLPVPPPPPPAVVPWVTGHAVNAGDDYPYETAGQFEHISEGTDAWNEYYGQCDSFAAWKVYENLAGSSAQHPAGSIPALGWKPGNASVSPVNQFTWGPNGGKYGNADVWASRFGALPSLATVNNIPVPGAIAWWPNGVADPQDGNPPDRVNGLAGSSTGHVGFVSDVYADGSITIEEYNMRGNGEFSVVHMRYGQGYTDTSFGQPAYYVPWPAKFIHVKDGASGQASPPEPAAGVVQAGYPGQSSAYSSPRPGLTVIGPGSGSANFAIDGSAYPGTDHGWYSDTGHGENGQLLWTNTHPGAPDSEAAWTPTTLAASTCYEVDAFVPDNWSNNDAAVYTVFDQHFSTSGSKVPVNENDITNDWAELGIFQSTASGLLPVVLTDQGAGDGQIAADAMRWIQQPNCSGLVRASQTIDYSNGMQLGGAAYPGTIDGWTSASGSGQLGNEYYTGVNGMTPSSSATWTASVIPNACYELFAYVPGNHSNDYQAQYTIGSAASGTPTVSVDENALTNGFAPLGTYKSTSSGLITVELTDQSLAAFSSTNKEYVAADTLSFVHAPCPSVTEGSTYPSLTAGPGSQLASFSLGSDWYSQFGHGDLGYEKWTHTNGATAVSTANWTFTGLPANTTYSVCAFIPDNYANNTAAAYQGFTGTSTSATFTASLNQAALTGWAYVGTLSSGPAGSVHVTLNDTGPAGTYTAADAMRLTTAAC